VVLREVALVLGLQRQTPRKGESERDLRERCVKRNNIKMRGYSADNEWETH
jgi:hypothetical protein